MYMNISVKVCVNV